MELWEIIVLVPLATQLVFIGTIIHQQLAHPLQLS